MRIVSIALVALIATVIGGGTPANAQYWQGKGSWCIMPPAGGGTWDCSYYNQWQCEQSASDRRGSCTPSPAAEWDRREGKNKKKSQKQRDY